MSLVHISELNEGDIITYKKEDKRGRSWTAEAEIVTREGDGRPTVTSVNYPFDEWVISDEQILSVRRMTPQGPIALKVDAS